MSDENNGRSHVPTSAQVIIIGGGVIGCSVAYHLAKRGWRDVLLLEKETLTAGTTWHAAGLIATSGFTTETSVELAKYTRELYAGLEAETGHATGFNRVGTLQIASDEGVLEDLRRKASFNKYMGVESEEISPTEVKALWPLVRTDDILAGFLAKNDGRANPVDVCMSLAKGAKLAGATICEGAEVTGITQKNACVTGVLTDKGAIQSEYVVNCAGMWGREVGLMAGVTVPLQAAEHYYIILDGVEGMHRDLPVLEDPSVYAYFREESGGLMAGLFEPTAAAWALDGIPTPFSFGELDPDIDRVMPYLMDALERIPSARDAQVRKFFCGPESFTPDLSPVVGEAPELKNFFVAAGLNSLGILTGGGVGKLVADWIVDGLPDMDVTELNIDRFRRTDATRAVRKHRSVEILGEIYKTHYPGKSFETARGIKRHVLHDRLAKAGAFFVQSAGWEIADWYAPEGEQAEVDSYSWGRSNFFYWSAQEHQACRENVIVMDMSFMSKFLVQGVDALECLNWLSCNDLDVAPGRIVYTQWVNVRGGIEADLTVTRLAEQVFMVVCSDTAHRHVDTWMRRNFRSDAHVTITDVTSSMAMLTIQGPKSRALLSKITGTDLSNERFPYLTGREVEIDYALVHAVRVTYLGELGWELYVPTEQAVTVYNRIIHEGRHFGLRHAGLQALNSLRLEKAYRDYGHDIDNMDTPIEAGLGFAVKLDKPGGFIGREVLLDQKKAQALRKRLLQFKLANPEPLLFHAEVIWRNNKIVGYIRAGAYGHTLGAAVGLGTVEADQPIDSHWVDSGTWEIEIAGVRHDAAASLRPLYDPELVRVKN